MADTRAQLEDLLARMESHRAGTLFSVAIRDADIEAVRTAIPAEDVATVLNALTRIGKCFICHEPEMHVHKTGCALGRWAAAGGDSAARVIDD